MKWERWVFLVIAIALMYVYFSIPGISWNHIIIASGGAWCLCFALDNSVWRQIK